MSSNTSYKYDYSKANKVNETPLFHVTPGKNCRMYPYIWSEDCAKLYSGPKKNPYICRAQGPVDSAQNYNGLPLFFEYNLAGESPQGCSKKNQKYTPQVL